MREGGSPPCSKAKKLRDVQNEALPPQTGVIDRARILVDILTCDLSKLWAN
nr:hypothetical protein ICEMyc226_00334 [Mycolicibacterium sp.]